MCGEKRAGFVDGFLSGGVGRECPLMTPVFGKRSLTFTFPGNYNIRLSYPGTAETMETTRYMDCRGSRALFRAPACRGSRFGENAALKNAKSCRNARN